MPKLLQDEFRFGLKQRLYNWHMRIARQQKGWRMKDLSEMCGVSRPSLQSYEGLRCFPPTEKAERIASALNIDMDILFPRWLKELRLTKVPLAIKDKSISLSEAIALQFVKADELVNNEWIDDIDRRVALEQVMPKLLDTLPPRERQIIELRFGFKGGRLLTYEEVASKFCVTRERIRQIEFKALRKLRHPSRSRALREIL